jgi:hypothetical protein
MVPVNYVTVLVCGVVAMIIGFLWYGPLFGKQWAALMGWGELSLEQMAERQKKARPGYVITFLASLLLAFTLDHAIIFAAKYLDVSGVSAGLMGGFWNWAGFVIPVSIGQVLWEGKPWKLWILNASYWLVLLLVMGVILALWM